MALLEINNLAINFTSQGADNHAVREVTISVDAGQWLSIIGESGSGKSITALSILRLLPPQITTYPKGSISFDGTDMLNCNESDLRRIRANDISIIFQEPMTSLNPLHTIEKQLSETLLLIQGMSKQDAKARTIELLKQVELDQLIDRLDAYPHELSGGQRQRVMIAMALACEPKLLIADEPTTALDVTVQHEILQLLKKLQQKHNMAILMISHDLNVVEEMSDHVCVMRNGQVIETGHISNILYYPKHKYTNRLIHAKPKGTPTLCPSNAPTILEAKNLNVDFTTKSNFFGKPLETLTAVNDISLTLKKGETLGIVGESGSGKTTLLNAITCMQPADGEIIFHSQPIHTFSKHALRKLRNQMQIVFQDPFGSLNPRMTISDIICEGLKAQQLVNDDLERMDKVAQYLDLVELDPAKYYNRYPHELSGGQRQRVAIARALAVEPQFIAFDEPTSALDLTVQQQLIDLLLKLQNELGLSYLFISHDIGVIYALSHRIMVIEQGKLVEIGTREELLKNPQKDYTKTLLSAAGLYKKA